MLFPKLQSSTAHDQCTVFLCSSPVQFHSAYWTTGLHDLGGFKSSTLTKAHARLSHSSNLLRFRGQAFGISEDPREAQLLRPCSRAQPGQKSAVPMGPMWSTNVQTSPNSFSTSEALTPSPTLQDSRDASPVLRSVVHNGIPVSSQGEFFVSHLWPSPMTIAAKTMLPAWKTNGSQSDRSDRSDQPSKAVSGWILSWILSWPQRHGFCALGPGGFRFSSARPLADQILPDRRAPIWSSKTFALQKEVTR